MDYYRCRVWGCSCRKDLEVHHIIPRSKGGPDEAWNLITLCADHHNQITNGKVSDIEILQVLKKSKCFRWLKALKWHLDKKELVNLRNEYSKRRNK